MTELTIAWMLGCVCGFFMGVTVTSRHRFTSRDRDPDWRRSFNHENTNPPSGPPPLRLDPGRIQRGNSIGSPSTPKPDIIPKPQPPGGRLIRENFLP